MINFNNLIKEGNGFTFHSTQIQRDFNQKPATMEAFDTWLTY